MGLIKQANEKALHEVMGCTFRARGGEVTMATNNKPVTPLLHDCRDDSYLKAAVAGVSSEDSSGNWSVGEASPGVVP